MNIEKYKNAMLDLTELLETLEADTKAYYEKYAYYKELKWVYETEAIDKKAQGEFKNLKEVELYVINNLTEIKSELAKLETSLKTNQVKRSRLQHILEYEKTALLLSRSLEKEDQYIPDKG